MTKGKTLKLLRSFNNVKRSDIDLPEEQIIWLEHDYFPDIPRNVVRTYAKALKMKKTTLAWFLIASDPENTARGPQRMIAWLCLKWLYFLDRIGRVSE